MSGVMEAGMEEQGGSARRKEEVVLRLLRGESLELHDGTITVAVPDTLWATDATEG